MLNRKEVVELLKKKKGDTSVLAFSREVGVSQQYLDRALKGEKSPGPAILAYLGMERIEGYRLVSKR